MFLSYLFSIYITLKENSNVNINFKHFLNTDINSLIDGEAISILTKNEDKYSHFCHEICLLSKKIIENLSFCETFFEGEVKTSSKLNIFLRKLKKITLLPIVILIEILNANTSLRARKLFITQCMNISVQV